MLAGVEINGPARAWPTFPQAAGPYIGAGRTCFVHFGAGSGRMDAGTFAARPKARALPPIPLSLCCCWPARAARVWQWRRRRRARRISAARALCTFLIPNAPPPTHTHQQPSTVTIKAGETVTWVNNAGFPHNIVFDEDEVPAGVNAEAISREDYLNAPGEKHSAKFDTAGSYSYYCEPHQGAGMVGKVIVQ